MDEGVRRLDCCLRIYEAEGLCGADNPVVLLLPLEPVPGRLVNPLSRSGVLAERIASELEPRVDPTEEREASSST